MIMEIHFAYVGLSVFFPSQALPICVRTGYAFTLRWKDLQQMWLCKQIRWQRQGLGPKLTGQPNETVCQCVNRCSRRITPVIFAFS